VERTERYLREECTYRKKMVGNVHWESRRWKTKSSNKPWSPSSTQIYEEDFLGFSYGFRPGRGQHDALDALSYALLKKKVNYIVDADIRGFFDNLDKSWMIKFMEHRIADPRFLRLIKKWLKAGVMEEGEWSEPETGTPQGSVISPLLANVYLHYGLDHWVNVWRQKWAQGEVVVIRYADGTPVQMSNLRGGSPLIPIVCSGI
jgi:retron-type reverse transcriptase